MKIEKLEAKIENKYQLANVVARRAKQLLSGAPILIETENKKAIGIAMEEMSQGKFSMVRKAAEN